MTNGFPPGFIDPVLDSADIEWLGLYYLTQHMGSIPIATRLPNPADNADTINGFLRLEAGGGSCANAFQDNLVLILHSYSPNEVQAKWICNEALKWTRAAHGQSIAGWSVLEVVNCVQAHKNSDPNVIGLTRYRAAVTWCVPRRVPPGS